MQSVLENRYCWCDECECDRLQTLQDRQSSIIHATFGTKVGLTGVLYGDLSVGIYHEIRDAQVLAEIEAFERFATRSHE